MRVLIGFECSGVVRRAFRALGHDAWSCDLMPADDHSNFHIQDDIWKVLNTTSLGWNFGIFHPTCTYLTSAAAWAFTDGPYHQRVKEGTLVGQERREARDEALEDVRRLMRLPFKWVIENPKGSISTQIMKPSQVIQPYQFGDNASKETHIWRAEGVPPLVATSHYPGRLVPHPTRPTELVERWANQTDSGQNRLTPGPNRQKQRSETYPGIANAMAQTWGGLAA